MKVKKVLEKNSEEILWMVHEVTWCTEMEGKGECLICGLLSRAYKSGKRLACFPSSPMADGRQMSSQSSKATHSHLHYILLRPV